MSYPAELEEHRTIAAELSAMSARLVEIGLRRAQVSPSPDPITKAMQSTVLELDDLRSMLKEDAAKVVGDEVASQLYYADSSPFDESEIPS